jgi:DNA-directed RNA polymerase beta' subunit
MIKIFRQIRQRLIKEHKVSKYLLYAIGEIILVVIGILIALSINNWNENRKVNLEEKSYLKRLLQENKEDVLVFTKEIDLLNKTISIITDLSNRFKTNTSSDSL